MAGEKAATLKILGNNLDAKEKLAQIKEEADKLREDNPELTVKINRAEAAAQMAVLKEQLKGVRDEALEAEAAVDSVGKSKSLSDVGKAFGEVDKQALGSGLLWGGGIAAAAGPGVAALGVMSAGALGLGAALVPAVVGLGLFGAVVKTGITDVETADQANTKLTGGLGELQTQVKVASTSWTNFTSNALKNGGAAVIAKGIALIPAALKDVTPILGPVEKSISGLFTGLGKALNNPDIKSGIAFLGPEAAAAITPLGNIIGHLASMALKAVSTFAPLGDSILGVIDKLTAKADAGTNNALSNFLNWAYANGPSVLTIVKNLGTVVGGMGKSFLTLGKLDMPMFTAITNFLAMVAKNPIGADALLGLLVLVKVGSAVGPLIKLVLAFKELSGVINLTKIAAVGLDAVPIVLVITLIVAAIVLLILHWNTVRSVAIKVWHDITGAVSTAFNWVKKNWPLLLGILLGPIALAAALIIMHWDQIEHGAEWLLGKLESFFKGLPGKIVGALGDLGHLLWNAGVSILDGFLNGLLSAWRKVTSFVSGIASWIGSHKGPIEVDAVLLRPHGRAIMGGLVGGLQDGMPGLTSQLSKTTQTIAGTKVAGASGAGGAALTAEWIGGSGADQGFISWLKENIRIRGGDPAVLGR